MPPVVVEYPHDAVLDDIRSGIDDVTTSGSTLSEILRTLRILNEDNEITIFSLIGRRDLMAEAI